MRRLLVAIGKGFGHDVLASAGHGGAEELRGIHRAVLEVLFEGSEKTYRVWG